MKSTNIKIFILITLLAILHRTDIGGLSAQEGALVGTVGEVRLAGSEVIVKTAKAGDLIKIGDRLYVRIDGEAVFMRAAFPMQTIAKCVVESKYIGAIGKIFKGMPVYRYNAGVENPKEATAVKAGKEKRIAGFDFVYIPGGSFMMGEPDTNTWGQIPVYDQRPRHKVTISSGFWMGKYEVTQGQYQAVMGTNPSAYKGANLPVEGVAWDDAKAFCSKLSVKFGKQVRLPTEAEWEYACKAGTDTRFYWGDAVDGKYCWYEDNSDSKTHPVGRKLPNAWGLHDMAGNVWEWCGDWYDASYYGGSPEIDPNGAQYGSFRVVRGGAWYAGDFFMASAYRNYYHEADNRGVSVGFRVLMVE